MLSGFAKIVDSLRFLTPLISTPTQNSKLHRQVSATLAMSTASTSRYTVGLSYVSVMSITTCTDMLRTKPDVATVLTDHSSSKY